MAELIVAQTDDFGNGFVSETFGRLKTIRPRTSVATGKSGKRRMFQQCLCSCGKVVVVSVERLRAGKTRSCGCFRTETTAKRSTTHGRCNSVEYIAWLTMKSRCTNPNNQDYSDYGGRGIGYCDRWKKFENFFADMGKKPSPEHSIERKNTDGNYAPDNCVWTDKQDQANNRRSNRMITIGGKTDTFANWCRQYGVNYSTAHARLQAGWDPLLALSKPSR